MSLVLGHHQAGRRTGLSRGYNGARLLRTINAPSSEDRNTMQPRAVQNGGTAAIKEKAVVKNEPNKEDNLLRPPDDSDTDEPYDAGDIIPTIFGSASEKVEEQKEKDIVAIAGRKKGTARVGGNAAASTRSRRGKVSPSSSPSDRSSKRKSQEQLKPLGIGMFDQYGRPNTTNKKRKNVYGGKTFKTPLTVDPVVDDDSPKKQFKAGPILESPEKSHVEERSRFRRTNFPLDNSPATTPHSIKKFKNPGLVQTPEKEETESKAMFKKHDFGFDDTPEETNIEDSLPRVPKRMQKSTVGESPSNQQAVFKLYNLGDDFARTAPSIMNAKGSQLPSLSEPLLDDDDDEFATMTQRAKCPMCGQSVDPGDLREFGGMNTRQQERFCRSHQRKTAREDWASSGYPTIDWGKLDSRITGLHSFIKGLINGADSYYRDRLEETVNAGKNRSLLKSDFNPTPGYYGTRGLRAISENTMKEFTKLLKKRMVVDRLMAARGFTPYVEYVVVPEVAVKLIMEDMDVGEERAREIMAESLGTGELLSEEIRDVVPRKGSEEIENSDADE